MKFWQWSRTSVNHRESMGFIRAGLIFGISNGFRMMASLVVLKVMAVHLGPAAFGVIGQFMSATAIVTTLAGGAIATGLTKYVAQEKRNCRELSQYLKASLTIWVGFSAAMLVLALLCGRQLSMILFGTEKYYLVIWGLGALQIAIGAHNLFIAIINGYQDAKAFAYINVFAAFLGSVITTVLAVKYGINGALWGLAISPAVGIVFSGMAAVRKRCVRKINIDYSLSLKHIVSLLRFSIMLVVTVATLQVAQIVIRNLLGTQLGWGAVGIWQGLTKISDAYLQFFTIVLANYYMPRLAESNDFATIEDELKKTLKIVMLCLIPCVVGIWLCRDWIVLILFSKDFSAMNTLFLPQLVGDLFKVASYVFGFIAVAKGKIRLYIGAEIYQAVMLITLVYLFMPILGIKAAPYAHMVTYCSYFLVCTIAYTTYRKMALRKSYS